MKSYFAKLAARATLPNAPPAPSRAISMDDPFENVSTAGTPAATENVSLSESPKTQSSDARRSQSAMNTDEIVLSRGEVTVESGSDVQRMTPRASDAELDHVAPERARQTEHTDQETPQQSPVLKLEPNQNVRPPVKDDDVTTVASSTASAEPREAIANHSADRTAVDANAEQTISLKKADEFMTALFARRTPPLVAESSSEKEQPARLTQPLAPRDSTSRLQPAAKPRQPPEPPPEQPSLVIGKLTVEVVPPPSPPVTPRREVVVVRTAPNARSSAIHSSQRFGLGQF